MNDSQDPSNPQPQQLVHPAKTAMQQLDNDGNPILAKVLPGGGPLSGQGVQADCERCPGCENQGACHDADGGAA